MKNREKKIKVKDCLRAFLHLDPRAVVSCVVARPGVADIGVSLCCTELNIEIGTQVPVDKLTLAGGPLKSCLSLFLLNF